MTASAERNLYDEIPYPSFALPQTHPDRLATLATLFGMRPAPIDRCRVLELGCGDGANLIPMALTLPGSAFVGIDLAARPIARGTAMAAALGLRNIALHQQDIQEISEEIGAFDYIVAHGLYSWVPPPIREKILAICATHLHANGVAYVSYNTYPGGRLREITRELMTFHTRGVTDPRAKIAQARAVIRAVADAASGEGIHAAIQRDQHERIAALSDAAIFHDYLAAVNAPVYFHQFAQQAADHGLRYLAEADFFEMRERDNPSPIAEALNDAGEDDRIAREQYRDFLRGRAFRQTLLCHQDVTLDRTVNPARLVDLFIASPVRARAPAPDIHSPSPETFVGLTGAEMTTNHPLAKAALRALGEQWPQAIHFPALLALATENSGTADDEGARLLANVVLGAYTAGLIELHVQPLPFTLRVSATPLASPLARLQLRDGPIVTSLRHTSVRMDDIRGSALLELLDGTRDLAALREALAARGLSDAGEQDVQRDLIRIAHLALLIA
ncbi:MAG: methyltransferase regulatory domain-containing protein [Thermomicrobiales bacterium]